MKLRRTHYCVEVRESDLSKEVVVCGWVDRWRDHGGVTFIDLRDRSGVVQVVFDPSEHDIDGARLLRQEWVIGAKGRVRERPEGMTNAKLPTGKIEILTSELEVFSRAETLPFSLHEDAPSAGETDESIRLKYRYLDLRRPRLQNNLRIRHQFLQTVRDFYTREGFVEIETPILYKSTPEGARDYLVPSRLSSGSFYALPQSPQTLKQLCMISGFDRYFQIARCFRDEDLRADRQPEFTQVDVELSFADAETVYGVHEKLIQSVFSRVLDKNLSAPFQRMPYSEAMEKYGTDKPDLRNTLTLLDLSESGKKTSFKVYQEAIAAGGIIKGLCFEEKQPLSRKELDALPAQVAPYGAKGLTWIRIKAPGDWQSPAAKFFPEELKAEVENLLPFKAPCLLLMVCAHPKIANNAMAALRDEYSQKLGYTTNEPFHPLWVTDFPLFEYHEEDQRLYAAHHPFTSPHPDDRERFMEGDLKEGQTLRANAYDLVINGYEVGGGSIRIHDAQMQARMFHWLQISEEEAQEKFGFFMNALKYGTPPHGGIALGVDRIAMILAGTDAIRDVIAFPKTQKATDLMCGSPSEVSEAQMKELGIRIPKKK